MLHFLREQHENTFVCQLRAKAFGKDKDSEFFANEQHACALSRTKKQPPERICRQVGAEAGTDCRSRGKPHNGVAAGAKEAVFNELSGRKGKNNRKNACEWKKVAIFAVPKGAKPESGRSSVRLEYTSGWRVVAGSNPVTPTQRKPVNQPIDRFFRFWRAGAACDPAAGAAADGPAGCAGNCSACDIRHE